jgi:hypothetical protein
MILLLISFSTYIYISLFLEVYNPILRKEECYYSSSCSSHPTWILFYKKVEKKLPTGLSFFLGKYYVFFNKTLEEHLAYPYFF